MSEAGGERSEALIARMKAARGDIYPEWEFAARQDPEFDDETTATLDRASAWRES
jgi:hypothetical protein